MQRHQGFATFFYVMIVLPMLLVSIGLSSCRSVDKSTPTSTSLAKENTDTFQTPKNTAQEEEQASQEVFCKAQPELSACCAAQTPTCNDCRKRNKETIDAWRLACLSPAQDEPDCKNTPIVDCCADNTEECRSCREAAMNQLMVWRQKCADFEAHSCDRNPPVSACCQAMIPSCESCRARNQRIIEEWESRCLSRSSTP